jgi:hypothetical protein
MNQPEYAIGETVKACGLRGVVTGIRISARTKRGPRYAYTVQIGGTGGREYPAGQLDKIEKWVVTEPEREREPDVIHLPGMTCDLGQTHPGICRIGQRRETGQRG